MSTQYDDYDSPWKNALEDYFEEFMALFFPAAHADIDWSKEVEFLDKELQQVALEAETGRRYADKLAKVWKKSGEQGWVLAHMEVQGQPEDVFDRRVYTYNHRLFDRDGKLVASFAVLTDDNDSWRPGKFSYELWGCKVIFEFPVVKLADYRGRWTELEASTNPFAIVVMAHLKTRETQHDPAYRQYWKFRIIRHAYDRGYQRQDILNLFRFIDWIMRLPDDLEREWIEQVEQMEAEQHMQYVTSVERFALQKGEDKGRQEGRQEGAALLLVRLLAHRFGEIDEPLQAKIYALPLEQIERLMDVALASQSLAEFSAQLPTVDVTASRP